MSLKGTGGGPKPPSPDHETIEILDMIPQEFETDSNMFDSDSVAVRELYIFVIVVPYINLI